MANYVSRKYGISLNVDALFDVQAKRLITPISGYIQPAYATPVGILLGIASWYSVYFLKVLSFIWQYTIDRNNFQGKLHIDDALDVFSVHGVTGMVGSICIGIFAEKSVNSHGGDGLVTGSAVLLGKQVAAVAFAAVYAGVLTIAMIFVISHLPLVRLRVRPHDEIIGLDAMPHGHGHRAYNDMFPNFGEASPKIGSRSSHPNYDTIQDDENPILPKLDAQP